MPNDEKKSHKVEAKSLPVPLYQFNRICWILLILILLFSGLVRYRLIDVPIERDEGEYAYAGQLILKGVPPYSEVYNMKLPGIYGIYALLLSFFGQTHQGIHIGLLIINSLTIILVFLMAKQILNPMAAVASAGVFAIMSLSQSVQGIFANAEHFVILFSLAGLLILLKALINKSRLQFFAAGVLLCIGFTMKQHGIMFCLLAIVYTILEGLLVKPVLWKQIIRNLSFLAAGMMTVIASLLLLMLLFGVFKEFWFWTIEYAHAYVSQVSFANARKYFIGNFSNVFSSAPVLWILAGFGIITVYMIKRVKRSHRIFLLLFVLFSFFSICPGFFFRPHYFILLLPSVALFSGVSLYVLSDMFSYIQPSLFYQSVPIFIIAAGIGQSVFHQRDYLFKMNSFEVCRSTYGLNPFPESLPIADFIRDHTTTDDTIAILGSEPQIYFYSKRKSASGYIYMYPLTENHQFALQMQNEFITETEAKKPKFVIFTNVPTSWLLNAKSNKHIFEWMKAYLQANYKKAGIIDLFDEQTIYNWLPKEAQSPASRFYVEIYERNPGK